MINSLGVDALIAGSQTTYWGGGISQEISAAAMTLYAGYHVGSTEIQLVSRNAAAVTSGKSRAIEDFQSFYTGAMIRF